MRLFKRILLLLTFLFVALVARGYWNATRDPIVRTARVAVADWPKDTPPVRVLLLSDVHVAGPDMPPERVLRIARNLNALKPDLVLIAGDLVSEKRLATKIYSPAQIVAPLTTFRAPLGTIIALGNHDHWFNAEAVRAETGKLGLTVLQNDAIRRGPLVIGGVDDDYTHRANPGRTYAAMDDLEGIRILLTHSPDIVPELPRPVAAVFAGHTHCGQITNPFNGHPVSFVSRYGMRFNCGDITDKGQRVFVTAGLGTSVIWLRYGAPPDVWLVTLGPV